MKGDAKVISELNKILKNELVAINQYFLHARMLDNWGIKALAEHERAESIDEMRHADRLMERILFLEGLPNLQDLGRLRVGETVPEILRADLDLELEAIPALRAAIDVCERAQDFTSRELLQSILDSEEEHVDWLETQLELIDRIGLENYIQSKLGSG